MKTILFALAASAAILCFEERAHAQLLARASSAARGQSGQSAPTGSESRGRAGASGSDRGAFSSDDDSVPGAGRVECSDGSMRCFPKIWSDAGLGDIGGLLAPWATVLGAHPYAGDAGGYALPVLDEDGNERYARTAFRLEAELGYAIQGAGRIAAAARVQLPFYVDLAARYSLYWDASDLLAIGRVNLELRLIDAVGVQLRIGAGFLHFHDAQGPLYGIGCLIGIDLFFVEPLVISAEAVFGGLLATDPSTLVPTLRARIGLLVDATEFYAGYHYEAVLGSDVVVDLGGPMLGVRHWM